MCRVPISAGIQIQIKNTKYKIQVLAENLTYAVQSTDQCREDGAGPNDLVKLDPISDPSLPYHAILYHTIIP